MYINLSDLPTAEWIAILEQAVQDKWICDIPNSDLPAISEEVDSFLEGANLYNARFLSLYCNEQIIGIALPRIVPDTLISLYSKVTTISPTCGQPWIIYIVPEFRGLGYSKDIVEYCKTLFDELLWFPDSKNHKSIQLARQQGFKPLVLQYNNPAYHWSKNEITHIQSTQRDCRDYSSV